MLTKYLFLTLLCASLMGCDGLEPLGSDLDRVGVGIGTGIGSASPIKSDTWNLKYVSRLQVPFGDIDPVYLDGKVPDSINFEMKAGNVSEHRVLDWGQLQLKDNGFFQLIIQYSRFVVRSGADLGPTNVCKSDIRGIYSIQDRKLILYPERLPTERVALQLDAQGALRTLELPNTCKGLDNNSAFESNIILSNLVFNAVR